MKQQRLLVAKFQIYWEVEDIAAEGRGRLDLGGYLSKSRSWYSSIEIFERYEEIIQVFPSRARVLALTCSLHTMSLFLLFWSLFDVLHIEIRRSKLISKNLTQAIIKLRELTYTLPY